MGSGKEFDRMLSALREREGENEMLKTKVIDLEKKTMGVQNIDS